MIPGVNELFERLMETVAAKTGVKFAGDIEHHKHTKDTTSQTHIIPAKRVRYLAEIAEEIINIISWQMSRRKLRRKFTSLMALLKFLKR